MKNRFWLFVVASDKIFYAGMCQMLIVPSIDGEKGIMAHHEDAVIAVTIGEARFKTDDGTLIKVIVGQGFAQMMNNRVTLLVESAESPENIDMIRAQEALHRAQEHMRQKQSIHEFYHTQASLSRAMARLRATSGRNIKR